MRIRFWSVTLVGLAVVVASSSSRADSPTLLVLDRDGNSLVLIDPVEKTVRARVEVGKAPHEVVASADGKLAVVANYGDGEEPGHSLSIVDLVAAKEIRKVDLGPILRPHGLALVEDGKVYFTAEMNRAIGRYDLASDKVDRVVGLGRDGTHMIVASPNMKTLYTADIQSGSVTVIRRETGKIYPIAVGGQPEGLAISPDGKEVWAGQRESGEVAILDVVAIPATVKEKVTTPAKMAARLRFTPDGSLVMIPDPIGGALVMIDAKTRKEAATIPIEGAPVGVVTDPEGKLAYVGLAEAKAVAILDLEERKVIGTIDAGQISDGMGWAVAP